MYDDFDYEPYENDLEEYENESVLRDIAGENRSLALKEALEDAEARERDDEAHAAEEDGKKDLDSYHAWVMENRRMTENGEMRN
jgi:hypothetical protein